MDVQKNNFLQALEIFRESIDDCEIVALDLEFTGVRGRPETYVDTIEERYSGLRRIASTYKIIQVGLSIFTKKNDVWEARPFNFFVFPSEAPGYNPRITLEVSAINFLKEHHMDFNTWFYNGIPYLNQAQAKELQNKLIEVNEESLEDIVLTRNYEQVKMNEIQHRIQNWLDNIEETLEISGLNAYLRKYLYNYVKKNFKGIFMESLKVEGSRDVTLVLKKADPGHLKELEQKRVNEKNDQFHEKLGFRRIFCILVDSKKPLIVHNGTLDLLFTLSSFQEDLPEKYQDFKSLVNRLFPVIYDTRYLLEKIPGFYEEFDKIAPSKGLKELYNFLKPNSGSQIILAPGFEKYYDEKYAHEAGFDAFMTGICFLKIAESQANIEAYKNSLPLYKCLYSIKFDNEDILSADKIYYIKGSESKHLLSGNEGFEYKYIKEDECFIKVLFDEKIPELQKIVSDHDLVCMTAENYFISKKPNSNKNS
jgi:poly(A)-specific ribonuclease